MGRLACNLPLLQAGLLPMSFLAVTPSDYISSIIAFYELGDPALLADVASKAYVEAAPHYSATVATQRAPRSAEIRHRGRVNAAVATLMEAAVEGRLLDVASYLESALADLPEAGRAVLTAAVEATLDAIGSNNFDTWEVGKDLADTFAEWRSSGAADRMGLR